MHIHSIAERLVAFFFTMSRRLHRSTLFPYTTLFRSEIFVRVLEAMLEIPIGFNECNIPMGISDRKSTRLNSSHEWISYAVFCLKKRIYASCMAQRSDSVCGFCTVDVHGGLA